MSQPPPPIADAVRPLDYAPPVGRSRLSTAIIGLAATAAYAFSGGMIAFGLMLAMRNDRDAAPFVAIGVASAILATGALVTAWVARR